MTVEQFNKYSKLLDRIKTIERDLENVDISVNSLVVWHSNPKELSEQPFVKQFLNDLTEYKRNELQLLRSEFEAI